MANTQTRPQQRTQTPPPAANKGAVAVIEAPRLAYLPSVKEEFGIGESEWRALVEAVFPMAKSIAAVNMALAYCKHRKLDIFKRPVHIVPIYSTAQRKTVETVWPGISEVRTTAMRTGSYAGMDRPQFGSKIKHTFIGFKQKENDHGDTSREKIEVTLEFPEWCEITVWRFVQGQRVPFPGPRVEWMEIFSRVSFFVNVPNDRWQKAPLQMLEKCAEAAALRRAFPEELGDEFTAEEAQGMADRAIDITGDGAAVTAPATEPKRGDFTSPPADSPPSSGNGQPASGDAAGADSDRSPEVASTPAPFTDVPDLNETPPVFEFEKFNLAVPFIEFSEYFFANDGNNANGAAQWLAFYASDMKLTIDNPKTSVKTRTAFELLQEKAEDLIGPTREPGQEG